jgi:hypothetical protein
MPKIWLPLIGFDAHGNQQRRFADAPLMGKLFGKDRAVDESPLPVDWLWNVPLRRH